MAAINVNADTGSPIREVQVEALVVMRIIKHATSSYPSQVNGALVGLDNNTKLEVTNSFPFPTATPDALSSQDQYYQPDPASLAAAAPRAKSNVNYQNEMIKYLREVNVDAQSVGWYTSTSMGNFVNLNFIENQIFYQKSADDKTVALVFDVSRSASGSLNLKAFRLSASFIASYKEGKFTTETLQKSNLRYQDILVEVPISIHNSHLLTSFLHQLPQPPRSADIEYPSSLAEIERDPKINRTPLVPSIDALDLTIDPFLEKTCDLLLDSIENHQTEQNNFQYWQRALGREQAKITAWQQKRKAENAARTAMSLACCSSAASHQNLVLAEVSATSMWKSTSIITVQICQESDKKKTATRVLKRLFNHLQSILEHCGGGRIAVIDESVMTGCWVVFLSSGQEERAFLIDERLAFLHPEISD
ncbi:hypothetical protein MRB53_039557 [Persea americana]|nr:hypothetical protein MRB53_039557 [Persea americana]